MLVSYSASPRGIQPILDPDADRLFNAIQVMNLGNNRTQWHNTCQRAVLDTARNAGLRVDEGLVIQLCTEGLGGEEVQKKLWDRVGRKAFWGVFGKCFGPNLSV